MTSGTDDKPHRTWRRTVVRALLVAAAVPLMLLALSLFRLFPWSGVNGSQGDIDISSGRIRHTRYLLWMPARRSLYDSALTKALSSEDRTNSREDWHPFVTLSPGLHHSPHYRFHGALGLIRELENCWEFGKMTPAARRQTAEHLFHLWRQTVDYIGATDYVQSVRDRALEAEKKGEEIDVSDRPMP